MKEINLPSGNYLFVEVPDNATKYKISGTDYLCFKVKNRWIPEVPRLQHKFQIISTTKDITEEQAESIVEHKEITSYDIDGICYLEIYKNYLEEDKMYELSCDQYYNTYLSLQSLIHANGLDINKNYLILLKK